MVSKDLDIVVKNGLPQSESEGLSASMPTRESIAAEYPTLLEGIDIAETPEAYAMAIKNLVTHMKAEANLIQMRGSSELINSLRDWERKLPYIDENQLESIKTGSSISSRSNTFTGTPTGGSLHGTGGFTNTPGEPEASAEVASQVVKWVAERGKQYITAEISQGIPNQHQLVSSKQVLTTIRGYSPSR